MKYGVVIRNLTDLRSGPKFCSERKSQLLYNEPISISLIRNDYCKAYQGDGYHGWVDIKSVHLLSKAALKSYSGNLNYQVISEKAGISPHQKGYDAHPPFLFYGTRVSLVRREGNFGLIISPNSDVFKIRLKNLAPLPASTKSSPDPRLIVKEARKFLGTPYLWGGSSPCGFDCSGLVQAIYRTFGIYLPRDSKDQKRIGRKIAHKDIAVGDLLFFRGHVAIAINRYRFIHSSLGEGGVAINSLRPGDQDFREDLNDSFLGARRVTA